LLAHVLVGGTTDQGPTGALSGIHVGIISHEATKARRIFGDHDFLFFSREGTKIGSFPAMKHGGGGG
jgi:hypothetical protein